MLDPDSSATRIATSDFDIPPFVKHLRSSDPVGDTIGVFWNCRKRLGCIRIEGCQGVVFTSCCFECVLMDGRNRVNIIFLSDQIGICLYQGWCLVRSKCNWELLVRWKTSLIPQVRIDGSRVNTKLGEEVADKPARVAGAQQDGGDECHNAHYHCDKAPKAEKFECQDDATPERSCIQVSVKRSSVFRDLRAWQSVECCPYHVTNWPHA